MANRLNIPDYFEKIKHPMDLSTVRSRLDASAFNKGSSGVGDARPYKHPDDVHHDMKLVFDNAMQYNSAGSDVHGMAQTVLDKFEVTRGDARARAPPRASARGRHP